MTALKVGLTFANDLPYARWSALGPKLATRQNAACWWLGDWLVFGERNYHRYKDGIDATGLGYQTLRNYAVVAHRFQLSRRRDSLSFQHHGAVTSLSDEAQDRWLDLAAANRWPLHALRDHLGEAHSHPGPDAHRVLRFRVDATCEQQWRDAAARSGSSFQDWIVRALEAAASANTAFGSRPRTM